MAMQFLSDAERARISKAIAAAERKTSGEIVTVVAITSASYGYVPPLAAAIIALLVPWPLILFTWMPVQTIYVIQPCLSGCVAAGQLASGPSGAGAVVR
jgi:putative membrane protein